MKISIKIIFSLLILASFDANANDNLRNKKKRNLFLPAVTTAVFVWGNPDAPAPEELRFVKAKNALVPVAPFVCGNPDEDAPELPGSEKAKKVMVPVAPFVWGDPEEFSAEIKNMITEETDESRVRAN